MFSRQRVAERASEIEPGVGTSSALSHAKAAAGTAANRAAAIVTAPVRRRRWDTESPSVGAECRGRGTLSSGDRQGPGGPAASEGSLDAYRTPALKSRGNPGRSAAW